MYSCQSHWSWPSRLEARYSFGACYQPIISFLATTGSCVRIGCHCEACLHAKEHRDRQHDHFLRHKSSSLYDVDNTLLRVRCTGRIIAETEHSVEKNSLWPIHDAGKQWISDHRLLDCLDDCERRIFTSLHQGSIPILCQRKKCRLMFNGDAHHRRQ